MLFRSQFVPPFRQFRSELDRLLRDFGASWPAPRSTSGDGASYPAVNVWEREDAVLVEAELPGLKSEDLDISVVGAELTLKGRLSDAESEGTTYHRRERGVGEFVRVVRLPVEVDADQVAAQLRDGVLTVTLPKAQSAKARKIPINAAT